MIKAEIGRQLMLRLENQVGTLAQITSVCASSGINLIAICAYAVEKSVAVMFVTEDNNEAKRLLSSHGFNVQEEEAILLSMDNKAGALQRVTDKLAESGIDLVLVYGSVDKDSKSCRIIIIAQNNLDAMAVIKTELERS